MSIQRQLVLKTRVSLDPATGSHRLRFWIDSYTDMTPYVFVYQRVSNTGTAGYEDIFTNIASWSDCQDYPETAPNSGSPFFRKTSGDLVYRSIQLLQNFVSTLQEDLADLIRNADRIDIIGDDEYYTFTGISHDT